MYIAIHNKTKETNITYENDRPKCPEDDMIIRPGGSSAQLQIAEVNQLSFKLDGYAVKLKAEPGHFHLTVDDCQDNSAAKPQQGSADYSWPMGSEPILKKCFPGKTASEMFRDVAEFLEDPANSAAIVLGLSTDGAMGELVLFYELSE